MTAADRPQTTLFLIMSVDGRITSHDSDDLDPNKKWKRDPKVRAITQQFYNFASGGIHTITSGSSLAKAGINRRTGQPAHLDINLIVIDHPAHLTHQGVTYLSSSLNRLYFASLKSHPALKRPLPANVRPVTFSHRLSLSQLMHRLKTKHQVEAVSIQSNAKLNARWLSSGLVDHLSVIISPLLVGRHGTPNLIDQDLLNVKPLRLTEIKPFGAGFVNLRYDVINS